MNAHGPRHGQQKALSALPAGVWVEKQPGVYQKTLDALAGLGLIEKRKAAVRWEYRKASLPDWRTTRRG